MHFALSAKSAVAKPALARRCARRAAPLALLKDGGRHGRRAHRRREDGGYLSTIESGEASDDESIKAKEARCSCLGAVREARESEKLAALLVTLRPLFAAIPKAKTAKLVKRLIEDVAKIPAPRRCRCMPAATRSSGARRRGYLRQRIQARLAVLEPKQYTDALALLTELLREVKRLDDKQLLVDIVLPRRGADAPRAAQPAEGATASLTAARTNANAIYCPPLQQAQIDRDGGEPPGGERRLQDGDARTSTRPSRTSTRSATRRPCRASSTCCSRRS